MLFLTASLLMWSENLILIGGSIMAHVIHDNCIACGTCISECPVNAIGEGDIYVIDPDACIDCGACAGVCPTGAIEPEA